LMTDKLSIAWRFFLGRDKKLRGTHNFANNIKWLDFSSKRYLSQLIASGFT
jgi:hypothetical protein